MPWTLSRLFSRVSRVGPLGDSSLMLTGRDSMPFFSSSSNMFEGKQTMRPIIWPNWLWNNYVIVFGWGNALQFRMLFLLNKFCYLEWESLFSKKEKKEKKVGENSGRISIGV